MPLMDAKGAERTLASTFSICVSATATTITLSLGISYCTTATQIPWASKQYCQQRHRERQNIQVRNLLRSMAVAIYLATKGLTKRWQGSCFQVQAHRIGQS